MGSVAGITPLPGASAYTAAKFGVAGLSKAMRAEFRDKGVRVCCVHPGATVSPSWKGSGVPARRMMPAEDVAEAFLSIYRMTRRTVVEEVVLRPQLGDL
jgi:short-subunit dehydrogenase